ncbi:hypothetical protein ACE4RU_01695 [Actinobacillus seminis]|uniref:hypothetical protein n=1 Tax=Actinobacillus seminis TaxID=722 RepID=UPI003B95CA03
MDILQDTNNILSFILQSISSKFLFWILLIGSVYVLLKSYDKNWTRLSWLTATISFYIGVIVPILNWKSGAYKCIVQGEKTTRGGLDFCREGMYAWYGENLWQWIFGIAIFLIFIGYFYIDRDKY